MTRKYDRTKTRKNIHWGRRHRRTGIIQIAGIVIVVLLSFVMIIGFAGRTGIDEEKPDMPGGSVQMPDGDTPWYLTLVNNKNRIPEDCEPKLTKVPGGEQVDERIYDPLMEMLEAAREGNGGELPLVVSGYRTPKKQQSLYDEKIAEYKKQGYSDSEAKELAKQWVAVPGYSEHQIGLAVDINGATYDVYIWLQENSYKYGFIFRYPGNKMQITGISEEVWHYRYVGVEAATEIYERGISLEEYLGIVP